MPDNKYRKQKLYVLLFTRIKKVVNAGVCACDRTHQLDKTEDGTSFFLLRSHIGRCNTLNMTNAVTSFSVMAYRSVP